MLNEKLVAFLAAVVVVAPLCAVCIVGPVAIGGFLGSVAAWIGGISILKSLALGILFAALIVWGIKHNRSKTQKEQNGAGI